jgi:DNA processing protein
MLGIGRYGPRGPGAVASHDEEPLNHGPAAPRLFSEAVTPFTGELGRDGDHDIERVDRERDATGVLVTVEGLGPATLGRLLARVGGAVAALEIAASPGGESAIEEALRDHERNRAPTPGLAASIVEAARDAAGILERIAQAGLELLGVHDAAFPRRLREIALPPHVLFVKGSTAALSRERAVAVVGTRRPTDEGRRIGARIGSLLARAGACVVSGLAVGIDGSAHAAVVAEGGLTVAVLGSGHGHLYPRVHARLADAIVDGGGAIVSEFGPEIRPTAGTFPRRNRIISGLAEATVVVEAGARSGALTTAAWALEQGRGCFLVPGSIDAPMSAGCLAFLRECAAEARIVSGLPQLLEDLGLIDGLASHPAVTTRRSPDDWLGGPARVRARVKLPPAAAGGVLLSLGPAERTVAQGVIGGLATADELVSVTGFPIAAILGALTMLEMRGLVTGAYGRYVPAGALAARAPAGALAARAPVRHRT